MGASYNDKQAHDHIGRAYFVGRPDNTYYLTEGACSLSGCTALVVVNRRFRKETAGSLTFNLPQFKTGELGIEALMRLDESSRSLVVLVVSEFTIDFALNWACHAKSIGFEHYIFYARDLASQAALQDAGIVVQRVDMSNYSIGNSLLERSSSRNHNPHPNPSNIHLSISEHTRRLADNYYSELFLNEIVLGLIRFKIRVIKMSTRAVLVSKNAFGILNHELKRNCSSISTNNVKIGELSYSYGVSAYTFSAINEYYLKQENKKYKKAIVDIYNDNKGKVEDSTSNSFDQEFLKTAKVDSKVIEKMYQVENSKRPSADAPDEIATPPNAHSHCKLPQGYLIPAEEYGYGGGYPDNAVSVSVSAVLLTAQRYQYDDTAAQSSSTPSLLKWKPLEKSCSR